MLSPGLLLPPVLLLQLQPGSVCLFPQACTQHGILVSSNLAAGSPTYAAAELTWGLILAAVRRCVRGGGGGAHLGLDPSSCAQVCAGWRGWGLTWGLILAAVCRWLWGDGGGAHLGLDPSSCVQVCAGWRGGGLTWGLILTAVRRCVWGEGGAHLGLDPSSCAHVCAGWRGGAHLGLHPSSIWLISYVCVWA